MTTVTPPVPLAPLPQVEVVDGCIRCQWCVTLMPQVFAMRDDHAIVKSEALADAGRLKPDLLADEDLRFLGFVADGCPAKVINVRE